MVLAAYAFCARQDQGGLNPLRKVLEATKDNPGRDKLELHLRIRSTQAISDAVRAAIRDLASNIFQLRVLESLS